MAALHAGVRCHDKAGALLGNLTEFRAARSWQLGGCQPKVPQAKEQAIPLASAGQATGSRGTSDWSWRRKQLVENRAEQTVGPRKAEEP